MTLPGFKPMPEVRDVESHCRLLPLVGFEPVSSGSGVRCSNPSTTAPPLRLKHHYCSPNDNHEIIIHQYLK